VIRRLRITVSVLALSACALLVGLWIRSYGRCDQLTTSAGECFLESWRDRLWLNWPQSKLAGFRWRLVSQSTERTLATMRRRKISPMPDFLGFAVSSQAPAICVPHVFLIGLLALVAAAPWMHWRFGLRAILSLMTLVAVALGLASYAWRK
jgi:hypothetical protein